ncbi:MAG: hypothetical protein EOO65_02055 [Methanosarcinales archaeon]|nr:MAG: hypothetical protein EOO65_02055 [Methanosarcinales archaeon]
MDEGGIIATVAGTGTAGFSGDGGDANAARLSNPRRVAAVTNVSTGSVVLYIADANNHRIRRVDEGGIVTTVAGNGTTGFSGDGGAAQAARLRNPTGVTAVTDVSSGGVVLYIAEVNNHRIRRVADEPSPSLSPSASTTSSSSSSSSPTATRSVTGTPSNSASATRSPSASATSSCSSSSSPTSLNAVTPAVTPGVSSSNPAPEVLQWLVLLDA